MEEEHWHECSSGLSGSSAITVADTNVSTMNVAVIIDGTGDTTRKKRTRYQRSRIGVLSRFIARGAHRANPTRQALAMAPTEPAGDSKIGLERVIADVRAAGRRDVCSVRISRRQAVRSGRPMRASFHHARWKVPALQQTPRGFVAGRSSTSIRSDSMSARARSTSRSSSRTLPGHG